MSRTARWIVIAFVLLFTWMILSSWTTDTVRDRVVGGALAAVLLTFAIGLAAPSRFVLALRIVAGAVAVAYATYFVTELVAWFQTGSQAIRPGRPSVFMAGIGLIIYGIPATIFALAGVRVGLFARLLHRRPPSDDHNDAAV